MTSNVRWLPSRNKYTAEEIKEYVHSLELLRCTSGTLTHLLNFVCNTDDDAAILLLKMLSSFE